MKTGLSTDPSAISTREANLGPLKPSMYRNSRTKEKESLRRGQGSSRGERCWSRVIPFMDCNFLRFRINVESCLTQESIYSTPRQITASTKSSEIHFDQKQKYSETCRFMKTMLRLMMFLMITTSAAEVVHFNRNTLASLVPSRRPPLTARTRQP